MVVGKKKTRSIGHADATVLMSTDGGQRDMIKVWRKYLEKIYNWVLEKRKLWNHGGGRNKIEGKGGWQNKNNG